MPPRVGGAGAGSWFSAPWLSVALVGLGALVVLGCAKPDSEELSLASSEPPLGLEYLPPAPGTYDLPAIQKAADGIVLDADGERRQLFDYMGDRLVVLSLVYTRCVAADGCPLAKTVFHRVARQVAEDPELNGRVRLVSLSFDPERDTPDVMLHHAGNDYLETRWQARPWVFLTTESRNELAPILDGYGQFIVPEVDSAGRPTGDFSHILKVFLVDRDLRVRNIYGSSFLHPAIAINDLKTLVMEETDAS